MNRDDIIRMAREATDEPCPYDNGGVTWSFTEPELERFANLVAAAEREMCAGVCDGDGVWQLTGDECSAAIRARGKTKDAPELFPGTLDALNALSIRSTSKTKPNGEQS